MSEQVIIDPKTSPELAAQQVLLRLVEASPTAFAHANNGKGVAESLIAIHKGLTEYYRSIDAKQ
ncbi:hypothetical protein K5R88_00895 [Pseudomonas sp. MM213]|uniref:hypothetical protein n=1 Tax=Pseudomonas sp. MM213 TaxID=2866807 RepID=UPI001CF40790|nr:hypothetical protein [Pseudomonas sp. MM213]UCP10237.1 hypothetical protein K5R88_00895 [Pseudomonas sp. MM213]